VAATGRQRYLQMSAVQLFRAAHTRSSLLHKEMPEVRGTHAWAELLRGTRT